VLGWNHVKKETIARLRQSLNLLLKIHDDDTLGHEKRQANVYPIKHDMSVGLYLASVNEAK